MWKHRKLADTKILVVDTWCQLDGEGVMVAPAPVPERISAVLATHPDWKPAGAAAPKPAAAPAEAAEARRPLPEAVANLSSVKKLRELARRLDIDLGDAKRRADVEDVIAGSDRSDNELVAVAEAIEQE